MRAAIDTFHAATIAVFVSSLVFIIGYTLTAPWWRYAVGRAVASLDLCLVVATFPEVLRLVFNLHVTNLFFAWYNVASLIAVAVTTLWRLATIRRIQVNTVHHVVATTHENNHPNETQEVT